MPIITLTTDFGSSGYYVALLKGHILSADRNAQIIDIVHDIAQYDIMEGAFFLKNTHRRFPEDTIHIVCVNTYFDSKSRLILFKHDGYYFIGPNNGLFSLALDIQLDKEIYEIADQDMLDFYQVIANAIQGISVNSPFSMMGHPVKEFVRKLSLQPVVHSNQIRATIMYIDHFGNVVINLTEDTFEKTRKNRQFSLYYKSSEPIHKLSKRYDSVPIGDVCAFFNSIGLLEIAVHMGNAHELLSLNKNETIQIDFY